MPSPVETAGFVVCENTWPRPPEASTTARHRTAPTPSRWPSPITCRVTPATPAPLPTGPSSSRSTARACSMTSISGARRTAAIRARWISAPVASPPAWAIRSRWWPPSRVRLSSPSGSLSKTVPSAMSSWTAAGPSVTSACTASGSQTPAPATRVSRSWSAGESSGPSAAAMPPWAHWVEPALSTSLVTTSSLSARSAAWMRRAAVSPAMPEPTTTTSARVVHPGSGAVSRCGTRRPGVSMSGTLVRSGGPVGVPGRPGRPKVSGRLSISRVAPTRAATRTRPSVPGGTSGARSPRSRSVTTR